MLKKTFVGIILLGLVIGCSLESTSKPNVKAQPTSAVETKALDLPKVFMTSDISSKGVMKVYSALGKKASGKVALKLHMGEEGNKNYISPEMLKELVLQTKASFVDSNVYYGGKRSTTQGHLQVAKEHGFTYAPVDILDSEGEIKLPVIGGKQLKEAILGSHYKNYDFIISVAHFKGHAMAGFGGTFKNMAVGMASKNGKGAIHRSSNTSGQWSSQGNEFFEKIVEYTKAVVDDKKGNIIYINVLNNMSVDCDCVSNAAHPQMKDIGILASLDPVALDKASVDFVYAAPQEQNKHLVERIKSRNGMYQLDYAEQLGIGKQKYQLVKIN